MIDPLKPKERRRMINKRSLAPLRDNGWRFELPNRWTDPVTGSQMGTDEALEVQRARMEAECD